MNIDMNQLNMTAVASWVVFGFIVGLIAHFIDRRDVKGGVFPTILLGILGAVIGGFLANMFFGIGINGFNLQSLGIAVAGALLLTIMQRLFARPTDHIKTSINNF